MKSGKYEPAFFLPASLLPEGFRYPESYRAFVAQGQPVVGPLNYDWRVLDQEEVPDFLRYAKQIVPFRRLVPFMRRDGEDGVVCFDGEPSEEEPRIWSFQYCVNIGFSSSNLKFAEWLARIPPAEDDDE